MSRRWNRLVLEKRSAGENIDMRFAFRAHEGNGTISRDIKSINWDHAFTHNKLYFLIPFPPYLVQLLFDLLDLCLSRKVVLCKFPYGL